MLKNFTILKHRTCKLKLFIALTGKTVSFTFSLFLHHCYHHETLSYSHLLFSLVFSCIIFTLSLTVICAGQDDLCIQHTSYADKREALLGAFCGTALPLGGNPNHTEATEIQNLSIHNEPNPTSDRCRDIEREKNEDKRLKILEESMINIQREFDAQKATIDLLMASKTNKHISERSSQPPPEVGSGSLTCSQHCEAKWIQLQEQLASIKTELGETITMNKNGQDVMIQYTPDLQRNQTFQMNTIYAHSMQIHCLQSRIQNVTGNRRSYDTILREHNYCQRSLDINNSKPPRRKGMPAADQQEENVGYNPNNLIPAERLPFHTEYVVETNNAQYKPSRSTTHSRTQYDKPGSDKAKHRLKKNEVTKERIVDEEVDAGPSYASKLTDSVEASRENIAEQEWQTVTEKIPRKQPRAIPTR